MREWGVEMFSPPLLLSPLSLLRDRKKFYRARHLCERRLPPIPPPSFFLAQGKTISVAHEIIISVSSQTSPWRLPFLPQLPLLFHDGNPHLAASFSASPFPSSYSHLLLPLYRIAPSLSLFRRDPFSSLWLSCAQESLPYEFLMRERGARKKGRIFSPSFFTLSFLSLPLVLSPTRVVRMSGRSCWRLSPSAVPALFRFFLFLFRFDPRYMTKVPWPERFD